MSSIGKHINRYLTLKKMRISHFESAIGISNGTISKCIKNNTDIGNKWVSKIIKTFDDINPIYLLTGEGEVLLQKPVESVAAYLSTTEVELDKVIDTMNALVLKLENCSEVSEARAISIEVDRVFKHIVSDYNVQKEQLATALTQRHNLRKFIKDEFNL